MYPRTFLAMMRLFILVEIQIRMVMILAKIVSITWVTSTGTTVSATFTRIICRKDFSDDDTVYPHQFNRLSIQRQEKNDEKWISVHPGADKRPNDLHDFREKPGPTFPITLPVLPSVFYKEMLPDSLFDHLVTCTNTRARAYFDHKNTASPVQKTWKPVRLSRRISCKWNSGCWGNTWWNEEVCCDCDSHGNDSQTIYSWILVN